MHSVGENVFFFLIVYERLSYVFHCKLELHNKSVLRFGSFYFLLKSFRLKLYFNLQLKC